MTETSDNEERSAVPIPYSVITAGWVVLIIGSTSLVPQLSWLAWLLGPLVIAAKFFCDYQRFARLKDNPPAIEYKFHPEGVFAAVDQALKTLPGYFEEASINQSFRNVTPQKGLPIHLEYSITCRHQDNENRYQKPSDMKSTLYMWVYIKRLGNNCELTMKFKCSGRRILLEEIINHLTAKIDELVKDQIT